ncbi:hypothetical protein D3C74_436100 [compost metagenome]
MVQADGFFTLSAKVQRRGHDHCSSAPFGILLNQMLVQQERLLFKIFLAIVLDDIGDGVGQIFMLQRVYREEGKVS